MQVLFKNIPIGISAEQLVDYIQLSFKDNELNISANSVEMMEIQDNFTHPIEKFGIVSISSRDLARKVIQQFNGNRLNHYTITVREFFIRSAENDSRINKNESLEDIEEKRAQERRLINIRNTKERRLIERRISEQTVENDRRMNERRVKDRREKNLIYARRI